MLAKVIFGEIVKTHFGGLNIGKNHMHACMHIYSHLCKDIIVGLNISVFIQNSPTTKGYSSSIFCLIRYILKSTHSHDLIKQSIPENLVVG